jgi:hypothetical protein
MHPTKRARWDRQYAKAGMATWTVVDTLDGRVCKTGLTQWEAQNQATFFNNLTGSTKTFVAKEAK